MEYTYELIQSLVRSRTAGVQGKPLAVATRPDGTLVLIDSAGHKLVFTAAQVEKTIDRLNEQAEMAVTQAEPVTAPMRAKKPVPAAAGAMAGKTGRSHHPARKHPRP